MSEIKSIDVYREEALPGSLAPDSMYFVKVSGENFGKLFQTNNDGTITATMVGMRPRGDYSGATAYTTGDLALDQSSTWVTLQPTTGNTPPTLPTTSNAYWQLVAQGGADGVQSSDGSVTDIITLTQSEYDALTPNETTFYVITD